MSYLVRRAVEADAPALIELRRRLFAETSFMLLEAAEFTNTADDERKRIARLQARSNCAVLLAEVASQPVGVLTAAGGELSRLRHSAMLALGAARRLPPTLGTIPRRQAARLPQKTILSSRLSSPPRSNIKV